MEASQESQSYLRLICGRDIQASFRLLQLASYKLQMQRNPIEADEAETVFEISGRNKKGIATATVWISESIGVFHLTPPSCNKGTRFEIQRLADGNKRMSELSIRKQANSCQSCVKSLSILDS